MHFRLAVVTLNQWALDFEGNTRRIIDSITESYESGAIYRVGPELEVSGYSVEDGFYDGDTVFHCWQSLSEILKQTKSYDIVIDVGMPVHFNSLYNCRVICYKGRILFIRAKTSLAKEGIYREHRYFSAWPSAVGPIPFRLPDYMSPIDQDRYVPFGANFVLDLHDASLDLRRTLRVGWEICQELWDIKNVSSELYDNFGCHLVVNSSGSYWELRKLDHINTMIQGVSLRAGACYAYSNLVGCDGQRYVFSGKSCIYDRGDLVKMMRVDPRRLFKKMHIIYHDIDPQEISEHRAQMGIRPSTGSGTAKLVWDLLVNASRCGEIDQTYKVLELNLSRPYDQGNLKAKYTMHPDLKLTEEVAKSNLGVPARFEHEINCYVSLWLWDYLRRSNMRGFMVPLSGGLDSCSVAILVYCLCSHLHRMIMEDDQSVLAYVKNCLRIPEEEVKTRLATPAQICGLILKCCYLKTRFSGPDTESRARSLCQAIGANFSVVSIDGIYEQCLQFKQQTDTTQDQANLLEQNLQARLRMTMTYYLSEGSRIVLATGNVDEAIMGYLTKYDCSSADINPIGGLCKDDLKSFLKYCCSSLFKTHKQLVEVLQAIIDAPPSAELTGPEQRDEDEMGITYDEISVLGKVRRGIFGCCGPRGAFRRVWRNREKPPFCTKIRCLGGPKNPNQMAVELGELIKRFYLRYVGNRHKLTVLTPALHAETYSPDDNRFDHRQILFPPMSKQFDCINQMVSNICMYGCMDVPQVFGAK